MKLLQNEQKKHKTHLGSSLLRLTRMIAQNNKGILVAQGLIVAFASILPILVDYIWQLILASTAHLDSVMMILFVSLAISGGLLVSHGYFREVIDTNFRNLVCKNLQKSAHKGDATADG